MAVKTKQKPSCDGKIMVRPSALESVDLSFGSLLSRTTDFKNGIDSFLA